LQYFGACRARHLPSAEGSEFATDVVSCPPSDVNLFTLDLDTPEILRALEDFSAQILGQDSKFSFDQSFATEAFDSSTTTSTNPNQNATNGTNGANKIETAGLIEEFFTQPEFLFNLSRVHSLDSLHVGNQSQEDAAMASLAPKDIKDLKVLTPPVSPNMYSTWETPTQHDTLHMKSNENTDSIGMGIADPVVTDNYDGWNFAGNMKSDELFPDLSI